MDQDGATTHQFLGILGFVNACYILWLCLVCGVKKVKAFQVFFRVLLMCGGNNHKLHDLCACVDV
jgi:hypothetical protein